MAKIVYGSLAGAISGALGNDVFSHGRHGAYLRKRVIPTKAFNVHTIKAHNYLAIMSRYWANVGVPGQAAWNTWAQSHPITDRLGQKQVLFGSAAFVSIGCRMLQAGDTALMVPPTAAPPAPLTALTVVADASAHTCILTTAPNPIGANDRLWVEVALVNSPGTEYLEGKYKLIAVSAKAQATGLAIGAALEARFGTLLETENYIVRVSVYSSISGLLSGPKSYHSAVVA